MQEKPRYNDPLPNYGDLMSVADFKEACEGGMFIDYDGSGNPVQNGKMDRATDIYPSRLDQIPEDATHIMWFSR